jgi:hypothetical protein
VLGILSLFSKNKNLLGQDSIRGSEMSLKTSNDWNQFLIRFLLAFAFWEVIAFPLRMLFFSKFYYDPSLSGIFVSIANVYWLGPIAADFLSILTLGALVLSRKDLGCQKDWSADLLFGVLFSTAAYVGPILLLTTFLKNWKFTSLVDLGFIPITSSYCSFSGILLDNSRLDTFVENLPFF